MSDFEISLATFICSNVLTRFDTLPRQANATGWEGPMEKDVPLNFPGAGTRLSEMRCDGVLSCGLGYKLEPRAVRPGDLRINYGDKDARS